MLEQIHNRSAQAQGRMQAIQAGNEISIALAQEINKLRSDINHITALSLGAEAERQMSVSEDIAVREQILGSQPAESTISTEFDH